ncbi:pre-mRNA cleavage complex 2 protein Pcf11 [Discoglossus pictus]
MSEVEAREDACRDYQSSLEDLTFNSKPHINMLTILAEENVQFAKDIVTLIEAQIAKAPTTEKLPVMYLMDSIVKNVGRDYLAAFAKNLVSTFVIVFEKVDENTRKSLYKLRSTWDEIFPSKKLYALDVRVNTIDPAWPVKPLPPNVNTASIHVNPKFLNKSEETPPPPAPVSNVLPPPPVATEVQKQLSQEQLIRQQLLVKQKQLLELQQKKLELELEQTKTLLATSIGSSSVPSKPHGIPEGPHPPVKGSNPPLKGSNPPVKGSHSPVKSSHPSGKASHPGKAPHPPGKAPHPPGKAPHPNAAHLDKNKISAPPQSHDRPQVPTRDPRLNRGGNPPLSHTKDPAHKKDLKSNLPSPLDGKSSKSLSEKTSIPSKPEKTSVVSKQEKTNFLKPERANVSKVDKTKGGEKTPKKETSQTELKGKSKSPSPLQLKSPHAKDKPQGIENVRESDLGRRDPRLRKHLRDKSVDKDDEAKEKRKSTEKKEEHKSSEHRPPGNRSKVMNGIVPKMDTNVVDSDKPVPKHGKVSGNRKRSRSRSPKSRSPVHSPKRRERRSPKRRQRSSSPIPSLLKIGKLRPPGVKIPHVEEFPSNMREDRNKRTLKIDVRDNRRLKKSSEERQQDSSAPNFIKSNSEPKENLENWKGSKSNKRWKSGWEENKSSQNDDHHPGNRAQYPRHRDSWPNNKGVLSPRTPKQQPWLSVDANLQIPKELTSASKAELLNRANERLASGEITQDDFLVVAHQIRQLFQYQEEKQRCNVWDSPTEENKGGIRKKPLLSNAELTYYQHKAKLKRTQVQPPFSRGDPMDPEFLDSPLDEMIHPDRESEHGRVSGSVSEINEPFPERVRRPSPITGSRPHMIDDTSHESLRRPQADDSAHRRQEEQRELSKGVREEQREQRPPFSERFPLKRPRYEDSEQVPYGENPGSRLTANESNPQIGALLEEIRPLLDTPSRLPGNRVDGSISKPFEEPSNAREMSPNTCMRFDGVPGNQVGAPRFEALPGQPVDALAGQQVDNQRFEGMPGQHTNLQSQSGGMQRFEGPQSQMGSSNQPGGMQRLDGQPLVTQRFEGGQGQLGPQRFEGGPSQPMGPQRFEGAQPMGHQRFEGGVGPQRFDGSPRPPLLQQRFEGVQCQPVRFDQQMGQPVRFDGMSGPQMGGMRFERPLGPRFDVNQPPRFDNGHCQQQLMRFDGPMSQPRFDGAPVNRFEGQPPLMQRFDMIPGQPCQRFEGPPGHQTPPRFDGPMQVQPRFDGPLPQRFDGPNPHPRFDMPVGVQGPRFDNVNHPPVRQNAPPYGQPGPYGEPQNVFHGQPQGMQFQRPEQRFDMAQGPNFGPPGPGVQHFPNQLPRQTGPYFDDKNSQGPQFGNFNNLPVGNLQSNQQFPNLGGMAQPAFNQDQPYVPQPVQGPNPGVFVQNQPGGSLDYPENHLGQLDVNELFSKLLSTGILKASATEPPASTQAIEPSPQQSVPEEEDDEPAEDQDVPDLTSFTMEDLKHRYDSVINRLYTGIQCYSCGMRFTKSQTDVYADHLDWHYRQNRTEKDVSRKITHRRWYYTLTDWIEFEEIADLEERAKSQFFEKVHEEVILKTQEAAKEKEFQSVPAGPAGADEICDICQEQFEQYWDEEEEEWHLKNAMCVNEKIYHPSCYEDYKNTSSFLDCTPSPSKILLENPLNAMLNLVKEEPAEPPATVKEEPAPDTTTSACENIPLLTEIKKEPGEPDEPV